MRRANNIGRLCVGIVIALVSSHQAMACGVCDDDDRNAVYSHEAAEKVEAHPDRLEFVVLKVKGSLRRNEPRKIEAWLQQQKRVDPSSIKISSSQKSIGFVWEKRSAKEDLVADLRRAFPQLSFQVRKN